MRHLSARDGSTLRCTWIDPEEDGQLRAGPGEPLVDRTKLGEPTPLAGELARIVHFTDAHVLDPSSPARVPFLARFGQPVQSTFRPQEALTTHVLHGAIKAMRKLNPELVIEGGDLIDNAQNNELQQALALLRGGRVLPGSGPDGYHGVQLASSGDPAYYRPDLDSPRHPGLLRQAVRPFMSPGLGTGWLPVLGDHDVLIQGELVPSSTTRAVAVGDRALWQMPDDLRLPAGFELSSGGSPDAAPAASLVESFVQQALAGTTERVPPDPERRELDVAEVIERLRAGSGDAALPQPGDRSAPRNRLDYTRDVGDRLRVIVLDLVRREGGSGGLVHPDQPAWLQRQLESSGDRWVIVVTHHPLEDTEDGEMLFQLLDCSPRVIAALAGHTHRNRIIPRETAAGGYWLITTCSLIDFPQQCRALCLHATASGGVALETWMLDHIGDPLGLIARELSYIDAAGGRATHLTGTRWDRNARLFRRPAS